MNKIINQFLLAGDEFTPDNQDIRIVIVVHLLKIKKE